MKRIIIILLCAIFIFCSCEGKRGLTGDDGESLEILVIEGTLRALASDEVFWKFEFGNAYELDKSIITVFVTFVEVDLWREPLWYYALNTVYIVDDDLADPGYKYRITIAE